MHDVFHWGDNKGAIQRGAKRIILVGQISLYGMKNGKKRNMRLTTVLAEQDQLLR
ncbi:MAG: hypothetical protein OEV56_02395 [Dehalococcoidia bacterium]|nr:hypothetical protein [Dehalococcoidia bacterium]